MADWVISGSPSEILDPAFGTGVLIAACQSKGSNANYSAYELDPLILTQAPNQVRSATNIIQGDFLKAEFNRHFDGLIMNPPYIRHRELEGYEEARHQISIATGHIVPRSANLYVYFAMHALRQLDAGGRASILIPSEWMSANFSKSFKEYLLCNNMIRDIVMFSDCTSIFSDALTTACVLLCQKN